MRASLDLLDPTSRHLNSAHVPAYLADAPKQEALEPAPLLAVSFILQRVLDHILLWDLQGGDPLGTRADVYIGHLLLRLCVCANFSELEAEEARLEGGVEVILSEGKFRQDLPR
jgi:hypothetical protein